MNGTGLSLNRAIDLATAELLIFTDDVDIDSRWIHAYWEASRRHPEAGIFGGRVYTQLPPDTPEWFAAHA